MENSLPTGTEFDELFRSAWRSEITLEKISVKMTEYFAEKYKQPGPFSGLNPNFSRMLKKTITDLRADVELHEFVLVVPYLGAIEARLHHIGAFNRAIKG